MEVRNNAMIDKLKTYIDFNAIHDYIPPNYLDSSVMKMLSGLVSN